MPLRASSSACAGYTTGREKIRFSAHTTFRIGPHDIPIGVANAARHGGSRETLPRPPQGRAHARLPPPQAALSVEQEERGQDARM